MYDAGLPWEGLGKALAHAKQVGSATTALVAASFVRREHNLCALNAGGGCLGWHASLHLRRGKTLAM